MRIIKSPDTDRVGRNFAHYVYINALLITFFAARNNSTKGDQKVPHPSAHPRKNSLLSFVISFALKKSNTIVASRPTLQP